MLDNRDHKQKSAVVTASAIAILVCIGVVGVNRPSRTSTLRKATDHATTDGSYDYPFFAFNEHDGKGCGATLIHKDILLTAASCQPVFDGRGAYIGVKGREKGTTLDGEFHEDDGVLVHEDYDVKTEANNVMLVKLITATEITPVKLNTSPERPFSSEKVDVIGFNNARDGRDEGLQQGTLSVVPIDKCRKDLAGASEINGQTDLCAFDPSNNYACDTFSGGPLLQADRQVGIARKCQKNDSPRVFVRANAYDVWIHDGICKLSNYPPATCDRTPKEVMSFNSFVALRTVAKSPPQPYEFKQAARVTINSFKECYEERYGERLFDLAYNIDFFESGHVSRGRPSLHDGFNVYIQFSKVKATFAAGSKVIPSKHDLKVVFADCIDKDFLQEGIQALGGAFEITKEILFKTPID